MTNLIERVVNYPIVPPQIPMNSTISNFTQEM